MRKLGEILEAVVIVVIVGALVHTFLEDYAIIAGWTVSTRSGIIWAGSASTCSSPSSFSCGCTSP